MFASHRVYISFKKITEIERFGVRTKCTLQSFDLCLTANKKKKKKILSKTLMPGCLEKYTGGKLQENIDLHLSFFHFLVFVEFSCFPCCRIYLSYFIKISREVINEKALFDDAASYRISKIMWNSKGVSFPQYISQAGCVFFWYLWIDEIQNFQKQY